MEKLLFQIIKMLQIKYVITVELVGVHPIISSNPYLNSISHPNMQ